MKYFLTSATLLFYVVLAAGNCLAGEAANETGKSDWGSAGTSNDWNAQLSVQRLPSSDLQIIPADAGITDYRLKAVRNIKIDNRLTINAGGGYGLKHIDASASATLPQDLHALFFEVGANYRFNNKAFATLKLTPGFYSDFKDLGTDDLRMPILALGSYSFDNGFSAVGGFIYRVGYHSNAFIPALGFSYQPDQYWRIDLVAPRPAVTYFASPQIQLFVAGDLASDEYELKDNSLGAKAIKYRDYKAMAGLNYLPVPAIKLSTSVGYSFERKFEFYEATRPDMRLDDVPFFKLSLDIGW
jgi:hypothetical protein